MAFYKPKEKYICPDLFQHLRTEDSRSAKMRFAIYLDFEVTY